MGALQIVQETFEHLWPWVEHHPTETGGLAFGALGMALTIRSQVRECRASRKAEKREAKRDSEDAEARETERSKNLIAALEQIGHAKDAIVLEQAVAHGRRLAKDPAPVKYRVSFHSIYVQGEGYPEIPLIDEREERYLVERKYYGNQYAQIPYAWDPISNSNGFPKGIPKEWLPSLVDEIIGTLPARYPSYYSIADSSPYGKDAPREVFANLAELAESVEQPYLSASKGAICKFVATTYGDHWSKLPDLVSSILTKNSGKFPGLGMDFLHFLSSRHNNAQWSWLVRLGVIQGVSESICWAGKSIPKSRKAKLASAYISSLHEGVLDSLGPHRLFHDSYYCHLSYDFEKKDEEYVSVCRIELAKDHAQGHISIDRTLAYAVMAMGIVSADSLGYRADIMQYLRKVFESYRIDSDSKRLMVGSEMDLPESSKINWNDRDNFIDGIYRLTKGLRETPPIAEFLKSAEILVPDIREELDKIKEYEQSNERAQPEEDGSFD